MPADSGDFDFPIQGPLSERLSDPDTVEDAVARAGGPRDYARSGFSEMAFPMEWGGYTFNEQSVAFEYEFRNLECGAEYEITYEFEKIPADDYGDGNWVSFTESYTFLNMDCVHEGGSSIPQVSGEDECDVYYTRLVGVFAEKTKEATAASLDACGNGVRLLGAECVCTLERKGGEWGF